MKAYKYLISFVAGLLGILAQEPFHFWPAGILFVGFLFYTWYNFCSLQNRTHLFSFILCWATYSIGVCNWISYFTPFAVFGFLFLQVLYAFLFLKITSKIYSDKYQIIYFGIFFTVFEFLLSHVPVLSFSWLSISTIPIDFVFLHNFIRAGGGALLTFIFVIFSSWISLKLMRKKVISKVKFSKLNKLLLTTFIIFTFCLGYIGNNNNKANYKANYKVSVVQANNKNRYLTQDEIDNNYLRKTHIKLAQQIHSKPDLIVFPESAFNEDPDELENNLLEDLKPIAKKAKSLLLFNTNTNEAGKYYNTNLFYSPSMKYLGSYSKKRLVPFGEYVPLKNIIGDWSVFKQIGTGFTPGKNDLTIRNITSLICFESIFADDVRNSLTDSTELLVVTTNNRSYKRSGNSDQHLAQSKLRAIEFSIPVVQASVSGKTALITKDGQIVSKSEMFKNKLVEGSLDTSITRSFYANTFDWFSYLCIVVVICLLAKRTKDLIWKKTT